MEMYSEIGDRIIVGKLVRKFIGPKGNTEIRVDFDVMKHVRVPEDLNIGWDDAYVVTSSSRDYLPRIYYGPCEIKVLISLMISSLSRLLAFPRV